MPRRSPSRRPSEARFAAILRVSRRWLPLSLSLLPARLPARPSRARPRRRRRSTPPSAQPSVERSPARTETATAPGAHRRHRPRPSSRSPRRAGLLAIIIDDAGYSLRELQAFLDLPVPLTVAVLPNLPHSTEAARRVLAAGKDLILHCPMEPTGGENPGRERSITGGSTARTDPAARRRIRLGSRRDGDEQPHGLQGHGGSRRS